jgi:secreted Zn-dependent insulinase-like peptidase
LPFYSRFSQAELKRFHAELYSSNLMSLVVIGREPLDTLQVRAKKIRMRAKGG